MAGPSEPAAALPTPPPIVDLLHSVATDVAVSSAYRDDAAQIARLVDGDLASAWNSRTDELVGAWIEIRVPEGASVASIEMTVGYTREGGRTDLFTGNHRVSRVRVSRDGAPLGEHTLDTSSRTLQSIPATGGPGIYRIEVLEVLPGSRDDWRETCISELRVLGTAGTAPAATGPRLAIGPLGAAGAATEPAEGGGDPLEAGEGGTDALGPDAMSTLSWISTEWPSYEELLHGNDPAESLDPYTPTRPVASREELFRRILAIVEPAAPARVAALRELAAATSVRWSDRRGDLAVIVAALDEVFEGLEPIDACYWASLRAGLWLSRVSMVAEETSARFEALADAAEAGEPLAPTSDPGRLRADAAAGTAFAGWLIEATASMGDDEALVARRVHERSPPPALGLGTDWAAFVAAADRSGTACTAAAAADYDDWED